MEALLFANISSLELTETLDGSAVSLPPCVAGADLTLKLRVAAKVAGTAVASDREVTAVKASLGLLDARPTSGFFKLKFGSEGSVAGVNLTGLIPFAATATELEAAVNVLSGLGAYGACTVTKVSDTWTLRFGTGTVEVPIACDASTLQPVSFVLAGCYVVDGKYSHTLRLVQAPVSQAATFSVIVPQAPVVVALQNGGSEGEIAWNEVQKLKIPAEFRGAFQLKRGFRRTEPIGIPTSADEISERLNALLDDGGEFAVTEEQDALLIEFRGSMGATDHALLEVVVFDPPPGDIMVTLQTSKAEMYILLDRAADRNGELKLPLEITLTMPDEQNEEILREYIFRTEITILKAVNNIARSVSVSQEWNQPPARTRYTPFGPGQISVGQRHYNTAIGDGVATAYVINHNLGTRLLHVTVAENEDGGERLHGDEYTLEYTNNNSVTLTFEAAPAEAALIVMITTAAHSANFQAHEHEPSEVPLLLAMVQELGERLAIVEAQTGIGVTASDIVAGVTGPSVEWTLPRIAEVYPLRKAIEGLDAIESIADIPITSVVRPGGLLPAVHDAAVEALSNPLPTNPDPETYEGKVYENQTAETIILPGSLGNRSVSLKPGQFAAVLVEDNRVSWYRVAKVDAAKSSYYPTAFDRTLFTLAVNDKQLRLGRKLTLVIGMELAILRSNTKAQWVLVIEHGAAGAAATPGTPDANLGEITWNAVPILSQRILLADVPCSHRLGCVITRTLADAIQASTILYDAKGAGGSSPASANFFLRSRLIKFDTEDSEPDPRGFVAVLGPARSLGEGEDSSLGKAIITAA